MSKGKTAAVLVVCLVGLYLATRQPGAAPGLVAPAREDDGKDVITPPDVFTGRTEWDT